MMNDLRHELQDVEQKILDIKSCLKNLSKDNEKFRLQLENKLGYYCEKRKVYKLLLQQKKQNNVKENKPVIDKKENEEGKTVDYEEERLNLLASIQPVVTYNEDLSQTQNHISEKLINEANEKQEEVINPPKQEQKNKFSRHRGLFRKKKDEIPVEEINIPSAKAETQKRFETKEEKKQKYAQANFSKKQLSIIYEGLDANIDETIFAKLEYDEKQMNCLLKGLKRHFDISFFSSPQFNGEQMEVLLAGLERNKNITSVTNPLITADDMAFYIALSDLSPDNEISIKDFNKGQLKCIRQSLVRGLEVSVMLNPKFSLEQLNLLKKGLEHGINVWEYADPALTPVQMNERYYELKSR